MSISNVSAPPPVHPAAVSAPNRPAAPPVAHKPAAAASAPAKPAASDSDGEHDGSGRIDVKA